MEEIAMIKKCKSCNIEYPCNNLFFHKDRNSFRSKCKKCRNEKHLIHKDNVCTNNIKKCKSCNLELLANLNNFHYSKKEKDGLRSKCKICRNQEKKNYVNKNKDIIKEKDKIYRSKEIHKQRRKSSKYRLYENNYRKNKYKNDLNFKIKHNLRTSFNRYFKNKSKHTFEYLGIDLDNFKIYIQEKFQEGMTWENYGLWHIDHIRPLKTFDFNIKDPIELNKIISQAWHYTNLQPLWRKDNLSKGSKY